MLDGDSPSYSTDSRGLTLEIVARHFDEELIRQRHGSRWKSSFPLIEVEPQLGARGFAARCFAQGFRFTAVRRAESGGSDAARRVSRPHPRPCLAPSAEEHR